MPRRSSRLSTKDFYALIAENPNRQAAGDVEVTLRDPGNKLIYHIGAPLKVRKFKEDFLTHAECVFRLPIDWVLLETPEKPDQWNTIIARQVGTQRCIAVNHNGMSEVWY